MGGLLKVRTASFNIGIKFHFIAFDKGGFVGAVGVMEKEKRLAL